MIRVLSLPVLLIAALVIRLLWVALIPVDPVSDAAIYETFASNLYQNGIYGFPNARAYWAVGTAAIYAGAYTVFGEGALAVVVINLISSLVVVWGLWDLGRRWFGETEGRVAAALFVVWPVAIQFVTTMASELHFMAMSLLALMAWDRARQMTRASFWVFSVLAGLALAGATYIRPIALLMPAALLISALLTAPRHALGPLVKTGVTTVLILACVAPWSARNERVLGEPVFMSTNFWANLWMGNHAGTDGGYTQPPPEMKEMTETERSAYMKKLVLRDLRADPVAIVPRTVNKALRLHVRETIGVAWNETSIRNLAGETGVKGLKLISTGWWFVMVGAALVGAVILARRYGWWQALLSVPVWLWIYFTAVHAVIVVGDRYHLPANPMIALLAAVALGALTSRRKPSEHKTAAPTG